MWLTLSPEKNCDSLSKKLSDINNQAISLLRGGYCLVFIEVCFSRGYLFLGMKMVFSRLALICSGVIFMLFMLLEREVLPLIA